MDNRHPVVFGNQAILMPIEAQACWWKEHKLRVTKNEILGVRGRAQGNVPYPKYYLTMRCVDCNKNYGTVDETK